MMKNIIEQHFIKDKQSDRCICCVVNVNVNVNQHSFSQQFSDLIDSENLIQRPVVIVIDCSFPIVYHCRSSNQDIGAMLSAFIQQQSGQAPAANVARLRLQASFKLVMEVKLKMAMVAKLLAMEVNLVLMAKRLSLTLAEMWLRLLCRMWFRASASSHS